ncbi:hypothetical protein B0H17DRAFT_1146975 [Mycena rosella]|uniref:Uncharacterized protein n=1 Tax=Mycena rosella TaxID=1033263 RepID=A0AAD7G494_MYCRO|nr:hypothetical protein B0H17DRAFT_1146975 [Mycena rosella]
MYLYDADAIPFATGSHYPCCEEPCTGAVPHFEVQAGGRKGDAVLDLIADDGSRGDVIIRETAARYVQNKKTKKQPWILSYEPAGSRTRAFRTPDNPIYLAVYDADAVPFATGSYLCSLRGALCRKKGDTVLDLIAGDGSRGDVIIRETAKRDAQNKKTKKQPWILSYEPAGSRTRTFRVPRFTLIEPRSYEADAVPFATGSYLCSLRGALCSRKKGDTVLDLIAGDGSRGT